MKTCDEIEALLAPYTDGELSGTEAAAVDEHLRACSDCRDHSRADRTARSVLRARAGALSGLAARSPDELEARCRQAIAGVARDDAGSMSVGVAADQAGGVGTGGPRRPFVTRRWAPLAAAAALVLVVGGAFLSLGDGRSTVVASMLVLDHEQCFDTVSAGAPRANLASLERAFERSYGWRVDLPSSLEALGVEMLEARHCPFHDGHMAHVLARIEGEDVSFFVLPRPEAAEGEVETAGQQVILWPGRGRTYAVVGPGAPSVRRVAAVARRGTVVVP